MGFALPGISFAYVDNPRVDSNWKKKRKINHDSHGNPIEPPSVWAAPYNFRMHIKSRQAYDFNYIYNEGFNMRDGRRVIDYTSFRRQVCDPQFSDKPVGSKKWHKSLKRPPPAEQKESKAAQVIMPSSSSESEVVTKDEPQRLTLTSLPSEILVNIIALSQNITSVGRVNVYLHNIVTLHRAYLYRITIESYYVRRIPCSVSIGSLLSSNRLTDSEHNEHCFELSLEQMQSSARKRQRRFSGNYTLDDDIVVLNDEALQSPYLSYRMLRHFHVDVVLSSVKYALLRDKVIHSLQLLRTNLQSSYQQSQLGTQRLDKATVLPPFISSCKVAFPYLNEQKPTDLDFVRPGAYVDKLLIAKKLLNLGTLFTGKVETIVWFIILLNQKVEQILANDPKLSQDLQYSGFKPKSCHIKLKQVKQMIVRQCRTDPNASDEDALKNFKITNADVVWTILSCAGKSWAKFLLQFVSPPALENDELFWMKIMESKKLGYVKLLENYGHLTPGTRVLNTLARSSQ